MDYEYSNVEKDGKLWVITLNRPERMNALHSPAHFELEEIFNEFSTDPDAWVAIITGSGDRAFCAGNDLRYQAEGGKLERNPMGFAGLTSRFDLKKPIIAAVNGFALGGGCEISLACHIRVASETAKFGQPEVLLGILPGWGGTQRLPRLVGTGIANEIITTGRMIDAQEAKEIGLANHVVPLEDLKQKCEEVANQILKNGPNAIAKSLECIREGVGLTTKDGLDLEVKNFSSLFNSDETKEGLSAFVEKRVPNFRK